MKKLVLTVFSLMVVGSLCWADVDCNVCGMVIGERAPNHFLVKKENAEPLHACSIPCVTKARKSAPQSKLEVTDFNHRDKFLDGNRAFFLVKSKNIQKDLGDMVMPPYVVAFATKAEAATAQKKYGDGVVVQGFENALKEVK